MTVGPHGCRRRGSARRSRQLAICGGTAGWTRCMPMRLPVGPSLALGRRQQDVEGLRRGPACCVARQGLAGGGGAVELGPDGGLTGTHAGGPGCGVGVVVARVVVAGVVGAGGEGGIAAWDLAAWDLAA